MSRADLAGSRSGSENRLSLFTKKRKKEKVNKKGKREREKGRKRLIAIASNRHLLFIHSRHRRCRRKFSRRQNAFVFFGRKTFLRVIKAIATKKIFREKYCARLKSRRIKILSRSATMLHKIIAIVCRSISRDCSRLTIVLHFRSASGATRVSYRSSTKFNGTCCVCHKRGIRLHVM